MSGADQLHQAAVATCFTRDGSSRSRELYKAFRHLEEKRLTAEMDVSRPHRKIHSFD